MSRDSGDKETRDSQSKPDNPFIRFRQFADEQISSLLQGIIGLPSALSKRQGNTRWADFDDELKRRDELQARQKELRESEARRTSEAQDIKRKSPRNVPGNLYQSVEALEFDSNVERDLPLYSPVTKSLFAHLNPEHAGAGWGALHRPPIPLGIDFNESTSSSPKGSMRGLQQQVFDHLDAYPEFRSSYSLIPYLLFSPYSPLKLSLESGSGDSRNSKIRDTFPYQAAFTDLMMLSQGPRHSHFREESVQIPSTIPRANTDLNWLHQLYQLGILHQKESRMEQLQTTSSIVKQVNSLQDGIEKRSDQPHTEEEMYERFLRIVSPNSGSSPENILESIFADIEKEFSKVSKELKDLKPENDIERALKWIFDEFQSAKPEEARALGSFTDEFVKGFMPSLRKDLRESAELMQSREKSNVSHPDKIVSTTTTSEHTTNDDGSVETSVTVWKRFVDGRETVTTTTHTEDPARDEDGNPMENATTPEDGKQNDDKQERNKETGKKGWFWN